MINDTRNPSRQYPAASLTTLETTYVVFEIEPTRLSLDAAYSIEPHPNAAWRIEDVAISLHSQAPVTSVRGHDFKHLPARRNRSLHLSDWDS
jgi:D-alanyl-D-alanine carboxypeptidase